MCYHTSLPEGLADYIPMKRPSCSLISSSYHSGMFIFTLQWAVISTLTLAVESVQDQSSVLERKFLRGDRDDDLGTSRRGTGAVSWSSDPHVETVGTGM